MNLTPDSFSDGGSFATVDDALVHAERLIEEGADIIDIGGESTRPGSIRVEVEEEIERTIPFIEAMSKRFDLPISIDTSKADVATAAIQAGAEIINDISGLRWEPKIANIAAAYGTGLIIMHSRGEFETMHTQPPVSDVMLTVTEGIRSSIEIALESKVLREQLAIDIGIGFGKTPEQNLELIAKLDKLVNEFSGFPVLVGASRKSFIGKVLDGVGPGSRMPGSIAAAALAVWNGAKIIRTHDVRATKDAVRVAASIKDQL